MSKKLPSREAQIRFAEAAHEYRTAFSRVQQVLASTDLGRIPGWVFAIDRLDLDELQALSPQLREAEEHRRVWKVALHALAELIALEDATDAGGVEASGEPPPESALLPSSVELGGGHDDAQLRKLDRFITVVNMGKAGGCIYVNGTFQPVSGRVASTDDAEVEGGRAADPTQFVFATPPPTHRKPG